MAHGELRTHDGDAVAHLQFQMGCGHEIHAGSVDACDVGTEAGTELQLSDGLAVELRLGDEDTTGDERVAELLPVKRHLLAHERADRLLILRVGDYKNHVAVVENGVTLDELVVVVVLGAVDAGDHEVALEEMVHLAHWLSIDHLVVDLHREGVQRDLFEVSGTAPGILLLGLHVDAEHIAQDDHGSDDAEHTDGIGDRVAGGNRRIVNDMVQIAERLLGSTQGGRVGHGTGGHTGQRSEGRAGDEVDGEQGDHADADDDSHQAVEHAPAPTEGGEEARPNLKTDGVDKEHQAKLHHEMEQVLVEHHVEVAEDQSCKQYP